MLSSRRLTGPNIYSARAGAVLEVEVDDARSENELDDARATSMVGVWRTCVAHLLVRVGWLAEETAVRRWPGGVGLFVSAPIDGLLAATALNEQAWAVVETGCLNRETGAGPALDDVVARLLVHIQHDRNTSLAALSAEARRRDLCFSWDDEVAAVGSGAGVHLWPLRGIPPVETIDWGAVRDIPIALVTGSNGKTTTVRLLAAMLRAAGHTPGYTCTDGVHVGAEQVAAGDWAGPGGARLVLHDRRVSAAVLESARGGMLRRGLAASRADVAVITRIAPDHVGEYGIHDTMSLGEAKLVVTRALRQGAPVVLNADDDTLVAWSRRMDTPLVWCSLDAENPVVRAHTQAGGAACVLSDNAIVLINNGVANELIRAAQLPIGLGGEARYNIANAIAAAAAGQVLGLPIDAMRAALLAFGLSPSDNPGRLHVLKRAGVTIVVDFAHNPDGWHALTASVRGLAAGRVLVLVGQAGDRDNDALRDLAAAVLTAHPEIVVLKEMEEYLRGRELGEVTQLLASEFTAQGVPGDSLRFAMSEIEGVRIALAEARPGDLVILGVHSDYAEVMTLLATPA